MKKQVIALMFSILVLMTCYPVYNLAGADDGGNSFGSTEYLGYEFLDNNSVLHMWNQYDDYYFNVSNGIQFSNHYKEYWARNVLMLGYYDGDQWNLLYRTDELSGFNKNITGETNDYINATLWKDLSYGSYDFRLAIRYHLGVNDSDLTVIPYIKNLGIAIPDVLGFGWELKDIQIANSVENDYFRLRDNASDIGRTVYSLHNSSLNETYTNITYWYTEHIGEEQQNENASDNESEDVGEHIWNWSYSPEFHLDNHKPNGDIDRTLYLKWNSSLNYKLQVKQRDGQYNAPVTLFVRIGTLEDGQEKFTEMQWYDAYVSVGSAYTFAAGETQLIATCPINETDFIIVWMNGSSTDDGMACIGRVEGTTVTYGASWTFDLDVGIGLGLDVCIVNSTTNRFFVVYADDDDADDGFVTSATFNGMAITADSKTVEFETNDTEHPAICKIRDDYAVVCYNDQADGDSGKACVVYWDGSDLQSGTSVRLGSGTAGDPSYGPLYTDVTQIDTDKFMVSFINSGFKYGYNIVGTVSGTTITMGVDKDTRSLLNAQMITSAETDKAVSVANPSATGANSFLHTIDETNITNEDQTGSPYAARESDRYSDVTFVNETLFIYAYADINDGDKGKFTWLNASWETPDSVWGNDTLFNDAKTSGIIADVGISICRLNNTHFVVAFQNDAVGDYGRCVVGYIPSEVLINNAPTQSNQKIWNSTTATEKSLNATDVDLYPTSFNVTINDTDADYMNVSVLTNESGSWTTVNQTSSGMTNGTFYAYNTSWVDTYNTKYWISFNVSDDSDWCNETYHFTTVAAIVFDINRSSFGFGVIQNDTITYSNATGGADTFRLYNNGSCSIDIDINGTNATASDVTDWNLSSSNGDNQYKMEIYNSSTGWIQINKTADMWYSNMAQSTNITANIRITTPTVFYSGKQMSCTVYMTASIH